ncbi:uncharacterized protein ASPGLDRAFT_411124 [Aspergillus glaucus CBS 516.65]|uniref:Uncharacterized protein n=1 Tax=Aspergillus glaucus CBS 516.65 TaxID=1160497 RepID=A0A1L9VHY4_ASPGL|nr:hypothetical protein ASPGLDRAFT_411124 [Aspergillus glaucus CBS 516.65]OJJ83541.1 hypothetical protein ASPGLDRAFT_411124 [Aspergillus glaucus CBS 516.65]
MAEDRTSAISTVNTTHILLITLTALSIDLLSHPLPGQVVEPPELIIVGNEQEWEVEEVIASHINC